MSDLNPYCDGAHCTRADAEVRLYPLGGWAKAILCLACATHENRYRFMREIIENRPGDWPQVNWFECEPYETAEHLSRK